MKAAVEGRDTTPEEVRNRVLVLGISVDAIGWGETLARMTRWAKNRESRYVCLVNVHSVVTGSNDPTLHDALEGADLALPDGAPVAWMVRRLGFHEQRRVNGPDLMERFCGICSDTGIGIFLLGGTPQTLDRLRGTLEERSGGLRIAGTRSPPFREMSREEEEDLVRDINASGMSVVFVGLGCPKQEKWMFRNRNRVNGVMVGVGAAFDYHAGTLRRAPRWMQSAGLEWLFRMSQEPRRLWRRYLYTNVQFVVGAARQLAHARRDWQKTKSTHSEDN